jgi:cytochrome c-type biogenesis protein CcmH
MTRQLLKLTRLIVVLLVVAGVARTIYAQDGAVRVITDDEVNAIAHKLYCPVCENITLDTCGTAACADWRYEIRLQLESGLSEQQIVEDFVRRFGDRVVGTPLDPTLRTVSLVTPWVIIAAALAGAALVLARRKRPQPAPPASPGEVNGAGNRYETLFEQDIANS